MKNVEEALLGRPIQEALGLDTKEILTAYGDCHNGEIDESHILGSTVYPEGTISRILSTGIFHSDNGKEDIMGESFAT